MMDLAEADGAERASALKHELRQPFLVSALFIGYISVLTVAGCTVTPVDLYFKRGILPWVFYDPALASSRQWNFADYRDGDALFEYAFSIIETIKQTEGPQSQRPQRSGSPLYSLDSALGYPLGPGQNYPHGISIPMARLLLFFFPNDSAKSAYVAINIATAFWGSVLIITLWMLAYILWYRSLYSFLVAIMANPVFVHSICEPVVMGMSGIILTGLSVVILIRFTRRAPVEYVAYFLAFIGSFLTYRGGFYHFFLYMPLLYFFFFGFLLKRTSITRSIWLGATIAMGILANIDYLTEIAEFLSESNKAPGGPLPTLAQRAYAAIPLQAVVQLPGLGSALRSIHISIFGHELTDLGVLVPQTILLGFPLAVLGLIGWIKLKDKWLVAAIAMSLLYWIGPLQYLFAVIIGGPFATETTVRMDVILYVLWCFLAVDALRKRASEQYALAILWTGVGASIILTVVLITVMIVSQQLWFSGVVQIAAILAMIVSLHGSPRRSELWGMSALLLIPAFQTCLIGSQTMLPAPLDLADRPRLTETRQGQSADVGALLSAKGSKYTFHPNFWNQYGIRNVHSYRNPLYLWYAQLFWYQWYSANTKAFTIVDESSLDSRMRRNWLVPMEITANVLTTETRRYLDLTGTNYVATDLSVDLWSYGWKEETEAFGVRVWHRHRLYEPIRVMCKWVIVPGSFARIQALLSSNPVGVAFETESVLDRSYDLNECRCSPKVTSYGFHSNGVTEIRVKGSGGLLVTNIPFDDHFTAVDVNSNRTLEIVRCNHAFIGVKLPRDNGEHAIVLSYHPPNLVRLLENRIFPAMPGKRGSSDSVNVKNLEKKTKY